MDPVPVIDDDFKRTCLQVKMQDEVTCPVMRQILTWVTPGWDQTNYDFIYYLREVRKVEKKVKILEKKLNAHQTDAIKNDQEGKEWDITLISLLLKYSEGLAEDDDKAWSKESVKEPECLITALKNKRNMLAHKTTKLSKAAFIDKTEEIRKLIRNVLKSVGKGCSSHVSQDEIETKIDKFSRRITEIRDATFLPATVDVFEKESLFHKLKEYVKKRSKPVLISHLKRITTFNPLLMIMKGTEGQDVAVKDIFTGLLLEKEDEQVPVLLEDIIAIASEPNPKGIILLKGYAGVGKTTILKKITSDWVQEVGDIKGLDSFDLLLYAEFRDRIKSFQEILQDLLGDVHQCFNNDDFVKVVLGLKILVIMDGFDEKNSDSSKLFQQILSRAKRKKNLTVIVTTRPEAEEQLSEQLKIENVNAIHIRLVGIEDDKRAEFVRKYFQCLSQNSTPSQGLEGLLAYLKKTEYKMSDVWKLPYNLSLLTILWMLKPEVVNGITTEAELYWQILDLCSSKLQERLGRYQNTCHLKPSELQYYTKQFLEKLSWESLLGLKYDNICLPKSTYKKIEEFCQRLKVPVEEMAGAFLKKVTTSKGSQYSFPHKGNQEFMGAYNIYTSMIQSENTGETVGNIFNKLHNDSPPESFAKYQNLLIQTLSIFHVSNDVAVTQASKEEVLNLLEKSGLSDRDSWLKVLHNLKCDDSTAKWIVNRYNMFQNKVVISDFTFDAYCALLIALDTPLPNRDKIPFMIDLVDTPFSLAELARNIIKLKFRVNQTILLDLFQGVPPVPPEIIESHLDAIQSLLPKCERYVGLWSSKFHVPLTMKTLFVRLPDEDTMNTFLASLTATEKLPELRICLSVNVGQVLHRIPSHQDVSVYISDIKTEKEVKKVPKILYGLQPQSKDSSFLVISFPRCSLGEEGLYRLMESLTGFIVKIGIQLPVNIKPESGISEEMSAIVEELTQCQHGIMWVPEKDMFKLQ